MEGAAHCPPAERWLRRRWPDGLQGRVYRTVTSCVRSADEYSVWWMWIIGVLAVWSIAGLGLALIIGRGVRMADERTPGTGVTVPMTTADLPAGCAAGVQPGTRAVVPRRIPVPLPPVGVALAALVLALETAGYVSRLTGASGTLAQLLSMDAPYSVPRLLVAALFAVAAVAAVAGAQRGRRTWWLAVAAVAAGISVVKASSTVHSEAMVAASREIGRTGAEVVSALLAAAVVAALFVLSRDERRDRRRVLGALTGYAVAVVGLSAVSAYVAGSWGGSAVVTATFVEESGEALAGVAFLMAVLVGVAPQLVLPRDWVLRRSADQETATATAPRSRRAAD